MRGLNGKVGIIAGGDSAIRKAVEFAEDSKTEGWQDLEEHKVNDSISVFTVGKFNTFEDAEKRQNELIASGIDEAFGVNDEYIPEVGVDIVLYCCGA